MSKIKDAQNILKEIGMPLKQQNEVSALTLLSLAQIGIKDSWNKASANAFRIHDIMQFCAKKYKKKYAENTREVFRRQVIHQFEHARLVDRNPDDPSRSTNSGLTCYALTSDFLKVIQSYKTKNWKTERDKFISLQGRLKDKYNKSRKRNRVPVKISNKKTIHLSPGKHNTLQAYVVERFAAEFVPGSKLLYLGDTAKKILYIDRSSLRNLNIPVTKHDKLPDVVLYYPKKNWIYLIEAVTSHGPVTPKRKHELDKILEKCSAGRIYVSAFLTFSDFKKWSNDIAWETEIWIYENPSHMIHYNGNRFLGPH